MEDVKMRLNSNEKTPSRGFCFSQFTPKRQDSINSYAYIEIGADTCGWDGFPCKSSADCCSRIQCRTQNKILNEKKCEKEESFDSFANLVDYPENPNVLYSSRGKIMAEECERLKANPTKKFKEFWINCEKLPNYQIFRKQQCYEAKREFYRNN